MPIIKMPFERVDKDIVGPLVQASTRHKFLLVVVDYTTHYLEAIPLHNIQRETVAKELAQVFTRVGIQVVMDQCSSFMSEILQAIWNILGEQLLRTSVYYPLTNALIEQFNGTLKQMLRKFVGETRKDWSQWVPFLLFAIREVPQASTGCSPFELLYSRHPRGALDVLREDWEHDNIPTEATTSYLEGLRRKLKETSLVTQAGLWNTPTQHPTPPGKGKDCAPRTMPEVHVNQKSGELGRAQGKGVFTDRV